MLYNELSVSKSGYREWKLRLPSKRAAANAALVSEIRVIRTQLWRLRQPAGSRDVPSGEDNPSGWSVIRRQYETRRSSDRHRRNVAVRPT